MTPYYERAGIRLYCGDNREVVPQVGVAVAAVVTDPPYGLSFMGRDWDHAVPGVAFWETFKDAMEPGAHLLAFGGTRLWHRLAVAVEDAGFEVKDTLMWLHGQGFPKHKSLLKPAWEPVLLARKPGRGVLQIDACRLEVTPEDAAQRESRNGATDRNTTGYMEGWTKRDVPRTSIATGRWPANVLLDETSAALLDEMSGERKSTGTPTRDAKPCKVIPKPGMFETFGDVQGPLYNDTGGASRFFYVAKASRSERNAGLEGMPEREVAQRYGLTAGGDTPQQTPHLHRPQSNSHPTVKPLALMRWLLTLATPPGGTVLDPFAGSGSTLVAAASLGIPCIGVEMNPEYCEIAARRIDHALTERANAVHALPLDMAAD